MRATTVVGDVIRAGAAVTACRPWPRFVLGAQAWAALAAGNAEEDGTALLALWAAPGFVHAAFQEGGGRILLASAAAPDGRYAALSPAWPGAAPFERMVRDLWGLRATGGADARPFLDHGRWAVSAPLSSQPLPRSAPPFQPEFAPPAGAGRGLHQIPLGPARPMPLGAVHLRLHALGGTAAAMEAQGGYGHRGVVALMLGRSPRAAARVAARVAAGDGAVAHALAFARAAEAATGTAPPPRALALRALMGELERIAEHLRWWGGVCGAAGLGWPEARCAALRESVLRATGTAFGHRLMLDRVVPGGLAADLGRDGPGALHGALSAVAAALPELEDVGENHGGLRDRLVGRVVVAPVLAARLGAGGPVGRAAGRGLDARRLPGDGGGDGWAAALGLEVPVLAAGDAAARQAIVLAELRASVALAEALLDGTPPGGEVLVPWPQRGGEGVGVAEGPRGMCLHWLALDDDGQIRAAFALDPSWGHWPLLTAAMAGAPISELPLAERSLMCSAAGVDL